MSNLGFYRDVTKLIKAIGGPAAAKAALAGGAAALLVVGGAAHAAYEKASPKVKHWIGRHGRPDPLLGNVYKVHTAAVDNQGLIFSVGDTFTVIERDGDAVITALTGNANNPWVVSEDLLSKISDFPTDTDTNTTEL